MKGKELIDHMLKSHGFTAWNPPAPNTKAYKAWKLSHEEEYHGRWQNQQDHEH